MGRVDDAMRRAEAERAGGADPVAAAVIDPEPALPVMPVEGPTTTTEPTRGSVFERIDSKLAEKVVVDDRMLPGIREQYRRLAATLHQAQVLDGLRVVMIASAVEKEGKSLTASNLALTLSESYRRSVLLIDADLRRPSLHSNFGLDSSAGLTDALLSAEGTKLPLHQVSPNLMLLPAGRPTSDPMAALTSSHMRTVLAEAKEMFDWVIVDTPPVGILADANLLASMVDGTLLVVKAGVTPFALVRRAVDAIAPGRLLGVVLNLAEVHSHSYGYGYYSYSYAPAATSDQQ